jgi:signal transduction histidine kinase
VDTASIEFTAPPRAGQRRPAPRRSPPIGEPTPRASEAAPALNRPFVGIDRRGRITLANDAFRRTFGFAPAADGRRVPLSRFVPLLTEARLAQWAERRGDPADAPCPPVLAEALGAGGALLLVAVTLTAAATALAGVPDAPAGVVTLQLLGQVDDGPAGTGRASPPTRDPMPVRALLDALLDALPHDADRRRCRLASASDTLRIAADPAAVLQALQPVIDNACRYSAPDTPVAIRTRHEVADSPEERAPAGYVVVTIADRGCGMTRAQQQRAFEPFWRAPATAGVPGAGMGLAIARRMADGQGGWIELRSVAGLGTEVDVWLPAAPRTH